MEYHRISIDNDPKLLQVAQNLGKGDRIYLTGSLNYHKVEHPNGNEYENGFIQPINLIKLQSFIQ